MGKLILIYLAGISVAAIITTIYDKAAAKLDMYRIPESMLLAFSALGGSVAMLFTMLIIRHKTKHLKFMIGIPVIIIIQAVILLIVLRARPDMFVF